MIQKQAKKFWFDGRKKEQDQERHGGCSLVTVQPKNICNGNRKMPGPLLKLYEIHCPEKVPSYPFFLAIKGWREKPNGWQKLSPLGKNQIGKFLPKTAQKAGLQYCGKKIANHSIRKTIISRLLNGANSRKFRSTIERTKKNLQSLGSYKSASITHPRKTITSFSTGFKSKSPNFVSDGKKLAAVFICPTKKLQLPSNATSFSLRISKHPLNFQLCL